MTSFTLLAVGLMNVDEIIGNTAAGAVNGPARVSKGRLRGLPEPAQAGFVTVARGFSRRATPLALRELFLYEP